MLIVIVGPEIRRGRPFGLKYLMIVQDAEEMTSPDAQMNCLFRTTIVWLGDLEIHSYGLKIWQTNVDEGTGRTANDFGEIEIIPCGGKYPTQMLRMRWTSSRRGVEEEEEVIDDQLSPPPTQRLV